MPAQACGGTALHLPLYMILLCGVKNKVEPVFVTFALKQLDGNTGVAQQDFFNYGGKDKPFQSVFPFIPVLAPTSSQITNKACRKHSRIFVSQLQRYKLWALQSKYLYNCRVSMYITDGKYVYNCRVSMYITAE